MKSVLTGIVNFGFITLVGVVVIFAMTGGKDVSGISTGSIIGVWIFISSYIAVNSIKGDIRNSKAKSFKSKSSTLPKSNKVDDELMQLIAMKSAMAKSAK